MLSLLGADAPRYYMKALQAFRANSFECWLEDLKKRIQKQFCFFIRNGRLLFFFCSFVLIQKNQKIKADFKLAKMNINAANATKPS